jgi:hypothetical protein
MERMGQASSQCLKARRTLAGIEVMAMIRKGQMKTRAGDKQSSAEMFYGLAA